MPSFMPSNLFGWKMHGLDSLGFLRLSEYGLVCSRISENKSHYKLKLKKAICGLESIDLKYPRVKNVACRMILVNEERNIGSEESESQMGSGSVISEPLNSEADFNYWCRLAVWTLEEAAALCLGLDFTSGSATALAHNEKFLRKLRLVTRANQAGLISDPVPPSEFASWAQGNDIMFPAELRQAVINRAKNWIDWQAEARKYEAAAQRAAESFDFYKGQAQQKEDRIKHLEEELAALRKPAKRSHIADPETVNPKSFATLLKLVGGMAIAIYNFNPAESRTDVVRQIQSDLDLKGISLDADTIRKWVREGAKAAIPAHEA